MTVQKPALAIQGGGGVAPPPGAPHEVTAPLKPEAIESMLQKAAKNEKVLKPLAFAPVKPVGVSLKPSHAVPLPETGEVGAAEPPVELPGGPGSAEPELPEINIQPAASDTDTPSKGIPKPVPAGKEITGGWGEGPGQYFALDGSELRTVILTLIKDIQARLDTDLRFSIALTYPQVRCQVIVRIDGAVDGAAINDVRFDLDEATILHLQAMVEDTQGTPADMIRDDHGITKPAKHLVRTGVGKMLADVDVTA